MPYVDLPTTVTVKKVVEGPDTEEKFTFSVSGTQAETDEAKDYKCVNGTAPGESNYLQLQEEGFTNSTFTLGNEETYQLTGIIEGTNLTIRETEAGDYTPVVTVGNSTEPLEPDNDGNYTIEVTPGMIITFTNTPPTGSLTIKKDVTGDITSDDLGKDGEKFTFTISTTEDPTDYSPVIDNKTVDFTASDVGGTYTATVNVPVEKLANNAADGSITITGLPLGDYTITETAPADIGDYYCSGTTYAVEETTGTGLTATATVAKDMTTTVTYTNAYEQYKTVTIVKDVTGEMGDTTKAFEFTTSIQRDTTQDAVCINQSTVSDGEVSLWASGPKVEVDLEARSDLADNVKAHFTTDGYTLSDTERIVIKKVKKGDTFTVRETEASSASYKVTYTASDGTSISNNGVFDVGDNDITVTVQNDRPVVAPTGLESNHNAPYTLIVTAAGLAGLALIGSVAARRVRRRREE